GKPFGVRAVAIPHAPKLAEREAPALVARPELTEKHGRPQGYADGDRRERHQGGGQKQEGGGKPDVERAFGDVRQAVPRPGLEVGVARYRIRLSSVARHSAPPPRAAARSARRRHFRQGTVDR